MIAVNKIIQMATIAKLHARDNVKCPRRQIACMLLDENGSLLAIGHNKSSKLNSDCLVNPCAGAELPRGEHTTAQGVCEADIHAEVDAISSLIEGVVPYAALITCPPCQGCIETLELIGVTEVIVPANVFDRDNSEEFCNQHGMIWRMF